MSLQLDDPVRRAEPARRLRAPAGPLPAALRAAAPTTSTARCGCASRCSTASSARASPSRGARGRDRDEFDAALRPPAGRGRAQRRARRHVPHADERHGRRGPRLLLARASSRSRRCRPECSRASVELGRACVARPHRHGRALLALWRGIAEYVRSAGQRFLFGCCSLTSRSAAEGWALLAELVRRGALRSRELRSPRAPTTACARGARSAEAPPTRDARRCFDMYLRAGARIVVRARARPRVRHRRLPGAARPARAARGRDRARARRGAR